LRVVVFRPPYRLLDRQKVADCLKRFDLNFELANQQIYEPCRADIGLDKYGGYEVYRFNPREQTALGDPSPERRSLSRK